MQRVMRMLDLVFFAGLLGAFCAAPFLAVNTARCMVTRWKQRGTSSIARRSTAFPVKSAVALVTASLVAATAASVATTRSRTALLSFLEQRPGQLHVLVSGRLAQDPAEVVDALKSIRRSGAHHSHPTTRIRVEVFDSERRMVVELGRDSQRPREYWVFLPEESTITTHNEIGRLTSPVFDGYEGVSMSDSH